MKWREYFFCAKKTKQRFYSTIRLLWFSVASFWRISAGRKQRTLFCVSRTAQIRLLRLFTLWFKWKQRILVARLTQNSVHCLRPADILSKMALRWIRGDGIRFITSRLNHWWQMDYSDDAFHTFLGLDSVIYLAVNGTVTNLPVFIQNILNCVLKTNEDFMGLERHGGKWLMTAFSFWGGVTL